MFIVIITCLGDIDAERAAGSGDTMYDIESLISNMRKVFEDLDEAKGIAYIILRYFKTMQYYNMIDKGAYCTVL